jgi:hypothetical protein
MRRQARCMIRRLLLVLGLVIPAVHCGGEVASGGLFNPPMPESGTNPPARADSGTPSSDAMSPEADASSEGGPGGGGSCSHDSDCPDGTRCAFQAALACGWHSTRCSAGICTVPTGPEPCGVATTVTACGCDGTTVTWAGGCGAIFAESLAPVPFWHLGACESGSCSSDSDCGPGESCGYPAGGGCSAKRQCFSSGACNCDNVCCGGTSAAGCDGAPVEVNCQGFAPRPVCNSLCD